MEICQANTKRGERCNVAAGDDGFCFAHSPRLKAKRDAARHLGGKRRRRIENSTPFPDCDARTLTGLAAFLDSLLRESWLLENSVARSRCLGYIAAVQKSVLIDSEIETRLTALETRLNAERTPTP